MHIARQPELLMLLSVCLASPGERKPFHSGLVNTGRRLKTATTLGQSWFGTSVALRSRQSVRLLPVPLIIGKMGPCFVTL